MAEEGEGNKPQEPANKRPTFGVDTIESLKPPSNAEIEAEGAHGHVIQFPKPAAPEDLILQTQDVPSPNPESVSSSKKPTTEIPRIKRKPLQPGDIMPLNEGVVLIDEDGKEVGILDKRRSDLVLEEIIRDGKKPPIFILRTPDGKIIRTSKRGPTWLGHTRK